MSWKRPALISAAGIAAIGAAAWFILGGDPDRGRYPLRGIDVSHHQGAIDWARVAADDVAFAYVKVSEGGDHRDTRYAENLLGAQAAGIPVGAYHFFTLCPPRR